MGFKAMRGFVVAGILVGAGVVHGGESTYSGYLCCNMRSIDDWISDINYADPGARMIPAGTPVTITGYGRHRVRVVINGDKQAIGNDYSRDIDRGAFARRYVVTEDPRPRIEAVSAKVRDAIRQGKATPGMSRDEVIMALGYPVSSENPDLSANLWRYWRTSFEEFHIHFDDRGRVAEITAAPTRRNLVWLP